MSHGQQPSLTFLRVVLTSEIHQKKIDNLHTMCIMYILRVYNVLEDFYVFSNNILCISATFEQKDKENTE